MMDSSPCGARFPLDIHTHSLVSGHAYGTIREMAQAAAERGLELLGVSEHGPGIPGTCEPIYFSNLRAAPRRLYGVELLYGCEANVLNDGTISLKTYADRVDYILAGIHAQCYQDAGRTQNTDHVISCMRHEKVFFISHPDDDHTPLDYERLVQGAKAHHVALEVNNSSFLKQEKRLNCVENYRTMLGLCQLHRVPILLSSDAHDPDQVGRFTEAAALLEELSFDEELILNTSVERLKDFLRSGTA